MKKTLLFTLFSFLLIVALTAQASGDCDGCEDNNYQPKTTLQKQQVPTKNISIYPNPATEFIGLKNADNISQILIYNVVGNKIKSFIVNKGEKYYIADLPKGMYLVQMMDKNNKIYTTQRINKR